MTTTATSDAITGASISGMVHGGQQPVSGSHVYLYATGSTGYGSASTSLLGTGTSTTGLTSDGTNFYTTTGSSGQFSLAANFACPTATSQVYLLATGGNPGMTAGTNNSAITLMAGIGSAATWPRPAMLSSTKSAPQPS